jgi:hypothetical protein
MRTLKTLPLPGIDEEGTFKLRFHSAILVAAGLLIAASSADAQPSSEAGNPFGKPIQAQAKPTVKSVSPLAKKVVPQRLLLNPNSSRSAKPVSTSAPIAGFTPVASAGPKLQGVIHHSDTLPPLPAKFRAGAFYGAYGLPSPTGAREPRVNVQFKIPDWLAGKWERSHSVETQRTELPSNKALKPAGMQTAKSQDIFGTYQDKNGQIWQIFSSDHATGEVDRGEFTDRHTVTRYNLEVIGERTAVVEVRAFHLVVSKKTQRIVQSYQDEEFNTYTLIGEGIVKTDSSVKVFDGDGNPTLLTRGHSDVVRISRFEDMNKSK